MKERGEGEETKTKVKSKKNFRIHRSSVYSISLLVDADSDTVLMKPINKSEQLFKKFKNFQLSAGR